MKKLYLFLLLIAFLGFSCSKERLFDNSTGPDKLLNNEACKAYGKVIKVYPGDDLSAAFDLAKTKGIGAVVKLMPGVFNIGWTEVHEFYGTLTGSGQGISIITNLPDLDQTLLVAQEKLPGLITFIGGDVTVSNMSFQLTELPWLNSQDMNLLLFSDYTADFVPNKQHIKVSLDNLKMTGLLAGESPYSVNGVKFAPDYQLAVDKVLPRSNIDATVANSEFTKLQRGIYVWGCKSGNFRVGTDGRNIFEDDIQGIAINENLGLNVKICNNKITTPSWGYTGIDLNTGEAALGGTNPLEIVPVDGGNYDISNNTLIAYGPGGHPVGIMDTWRMAHPEYDTWMKMKWADNTFIVNEGAMAIDLYCAKNALFVKNIIKGDASPTYIFVENFWWDSDGVLPNNFSESCKFLNNCFLKSPFEFWFWLSKNCTLMGDISNLTIYDFGENTQIIGKTNYGHSNDKFHEYSQKRIEKMHEMHKK